MASDRPSSASPDDCESELKRLVTCKDDPVLLIYFSHREGWGWLGYASHLGYLKESLEDSLLRKCWLDVNSPRTWSSHVRVTSHKFVVDWFYSMLWDSNGSSSSHTDTSQNPIINPSVGVIWFPGGVLPDHQTWAKSATWAKRIFADFQAEQLTYYAEEKDIRI